MIFNEKELLSILELVTESLIYASENDYEKPCIVSESTWIGNTLFEHTYDFNRHIAGLVIIQGKLISRLSEGELKEAYLSDHSCRLGWLEELEKSLTLEEEKWQVERKWQF